MKVIVAGYSKTGTKSMTEALTKLGFKTYDFFEHWWFHGKNWIKILNQGGTTKDFYEMYQDVDAVVDSPASFFWEEIHKAFPHSKIILTIREENQWFTSYAVQVEDNSRFSLLKVYYALASVGFNPIIIMKCLLRFINVINRLVYRCSLSDKHPNETVSRILYRQHNCHVLQTAPKDKLLVYKISDGWEPLCQFLDEDVPDCPFPHKNKNASLVAEVITENPIAAANLKAAKQKFCIFIFLAFSVLLAFIFNG